MGTEGEEVQATDWEQYALVRDLSRNHLLLPWHAEMVDDFLSFSSDLSLQSRVLDVGAGDGLFLSLLQELGYRDLTGADMSESQVNYLKGKKINAVRVDVQEGGGVEDLKPPYDLIMLMEVLEHLKQPVEALTRLRGLLSPNGLLYLTVPLCDCVFDRLRRAREGLTREAQVLAVDPTHIHAFSVEQLNEVVGQAGLKPVRFRRLSFRPPTRWGCLRGSRRLNLLRALIPDRLKGLCASLAVRP